MSYTIKDVIEKLIMIEENAANLYAQIEENSSKDDKSLKIIAKALEREEQRHGYYFRKALEEPPKDIDVDIEIDFHTYDKVAQLLWEFKNKLYLPKVENVAELISFAYNFEKENLALLIDIQGRLVKKETDVEKESYKIMSRLIEQEQAHVENLRPYLKL